MSGTPLNITFQPKALHDEMGAVYDEYGRMSGMLGLEVPSQTISNPDISCPMVMPARRRMS